MSTELKQEALVPTVPALGSVAPAIERALVMGDLAGLQPEQRVSLYKAICESVGLNPLTRPFEYITLNGKLTLYARKDAGDQLRRIHNISIDIVSREMVDDCYVVKALALTADGRQDEAIGAISLTNLKGEAKANAIMKAETKAKRRVTLSICGLGIIDESEAESRPRRGPWQFASHAPPSEIEVEVVSGELGGPGDAAGGGDNMGSLDTPPKTAEEPGELSEDAVLDLQLAIESAASLEELKTYGEMARRAPDAKQAILRDLYIVVQRKLKAKAKE